jgi:hypothetical protein
MIALAIGSVIGYLDSRPTWDDTGITFVTIALGAAALGLLRPRFGIVLGVLLGLTVFGVESLATGGAAAAVAIVVGMVGGGFGAVLGGQRGITTRY